MGRENVKSRQLMIHTVACKPDSNHQGGHNSAQRLVKIGAGLFRYMKKARGRDLCADFIGQTVKITDHRVGHYTRFQCQCGAAVSGHTDRSQRLRQNHVSRIARTTSDQCNWRFAFNNCLIHGGIHPIFGNRSQSRHEMIPC
ncbi:hypothetical protein SULPSESMR1_00823 [Pseudosulfitobacter pseudonitzschiae]|uniref:Uncharacterized protein n=1 Tax=Pseudosulfitobacter pseudonitzschiae TaxID=1402135 RepID=A0A221JY43_9RHOB|nr:hypothetical protein SULPSESMR1_00823 [Pseudosulfitobacter pseudonitzschiae]